MTEEELKKAEQNYKRRLKKLQAREKELEAKEDGIEQSVLRLEAAQLLAEQQLDNAREERVAAGESRNIAASYEEILKTRVQDAQPYHPILEYEERDYITHDAPVSSMDFFRHFILLPRIHTHSQDVQLHLRYAIASPKNKHQKACTYVHSLEALRGPYNSNIQRRMVEDISRGITNRVMESMFGITEEMIEELEFGD